MSSLDIDGHDDACNTKKISDKFLFSHDLKNQRDHIFCRYDIASLYKAASIHPTDDWSIGALVRPIRNQLTKMWT